MTSNLLENFVHLGPAELAAEGAVLSLRMGAAAGTQWIVANLVKKSKLTDWKIELLGAGAQIDNLQQLAHELGIADRVLFSPAVARAEAAQRMRAADLLFLHLMGDATMERTIPSKLFAVSSSTV